MVVVMVLKMLHKSYISRLCPILRCNPPSSPQNLRWFTTMASKPINRWFSVILKKSCIASYYRQFSTNIKIEIITIFVILGLRPLEAIKTAGSLTFFILILAESCL